MNNDLKLKLLSLIEPNVIAALIAHNHISLSGKKLCWENVIVNDYTLELLHINESKDENFLRTFIEIFPKMGRSSVEAVRKRLKQFRSKTQFDEISEDEMLECAKRYCYGKEDKYCGKILNFIFKHENGIYTSRLENELKLLREEYEKVPDEVVNISVSGYEGYDLT